VTNGLAAYWIYQHLGNLTAAERESDPAFAALRRGDESPALEVFDRRARHGADGTMGVRWSYARDLGLARLAMVDSRDGRVLAGGQRHLLDSDESQWLEDQVKQPAPYFLLGTSLPLLLPRGVHELERINAVACAGRWGRLVARISEELRQAAQLSHWITFPASFDRVLRLLHAAGDQQRQGVIVLSGDVHFSYAAQIRAWPDGTRPVTPTHQLVSSPLCHDLGYGIAGGLRVLASRFGDVIGRLAGRLAGAPPPPLHWTIETGPWWNNVISTLDLSPDQATVRFERTNARGSLGARLETAAEQRLS
jgi:hypothetical protein